MNYKEYCVRLKPNKPRDPSENPVQKRVDSSKSATNKHYQATTIRTINHPKCGQNEKSSRMATRMLVFARYFHTGHVINRRSLRISRLTKKNS